MPFKSDAQRKYMFAKMPKVAKKWADKYETPKELPEHIKRRAVDIIKKKKGK